MRVPGSIIEDMPKKEAFSKTLFRKEFDGVMPLETMTDTKTQKKGVMSLSTLKRMEELAIDEIPEPSKPFVNAVKYSKKQAYYNGKPDYELPTQKSNFWF
jgi:hypothetical protein